MAGQQVDGEALVDEVTQLATDHADLVIAVGKLLANSVRTSDASSCRVVHLCEDELNTLRRLTGGS